LPAPPNPGLTSFSPAQGDGPRSFLEAACFSIVGGRAVRLDILDRVDEVLGTASSRRADVDQSLNTLVSLLGSNIETALAVAGGLGWKQVPGDTGDSSVLHWQQVPSRKRMQRKRSQRDSPFAGLSVLTSPE
jgi:ATP-dependent RNA helicase SUPV3L1/SUV3